MKNVLIFSLIICSIQASAKNYYEYYEEVNKARLAIVDDNLRVAQTHYYNTFEKFDFAFARDCYNALQVSAKLEDFQKIDYFLSRCLTQGVEFEILQQNPMLYTFRQSDLWTSVIADKDSLQAVYNDNVDWEIRAEVIEM